MNVSLYQAAAAMNAQERWQDLISENLASGSVPGFRKQEVSFEDVAASSANGVNDSANSNFYIPTVVSSTSFQEGQMNPTGDSTDLAIDGKGFFQIQLPGGQTGYTRDGEFQLNAKRQLVTKEGYPVMGDAGPIQFPPGGGSEFTVAANGRVTQGGAVVGNLRLMQFSNPGQLTSTSDGYLLANQPGMTPTPADPKTTIRQGYLEGANTSPTNDMSSLINAMRVFEANQKVMQAQDDRMGKVISDLSGTT